MNKAYSYIGAFNKKNCFRGRGCYYIILLLISFALCYSPASLAKQELRGFKKVMRGSVRKRGVRQFKYLQAHLFQEEVRKHRYWLFIMNLGNYPIRMNYFSDKLYIIGKNNKEYLPRLTRKDYPKSIIPNRSAKIQFYFSDLPIEEIERVIVRMVYDHTVIELKPLASVDTPSERDAPTGESGEAVEGSDNPQEQEKNH